MKPSRSKFIPGFDERYTVTKSGKVYSMLRKKYLTEETDKRRESFYKRVSLSKNVGDINQHYLVHRLVAMTYIPNPNKLPEVNHKNGNTLDNRSVNLEWCTRKHNMEHANTVLEYKNDMKKITDLNEKEIENIKRSHQSNMFLSKKFKISVANIHKIRNYLI